jgi:GTPase SAR1 family protein
VGLTSWLSDVRTLASPDLVVLLVGNKTDRAEDREVSYLEASRFAQEHGKSICYQFITSLVEQ